MVFIRRILSSNLNNCSNIPFLPPLYPNERTQLTRQRSNTYYLSMKSTIDPESGDTSLDPEANAKGHSNKGYIEDLGNSLNSQKTEPEVGKSQDEEDPESRSREQWGNGIEFLLTCIAMSVGLGNVWRFPFIAYKNGGGAFLIPYLVVLTVIGRPIYFLELAMGQFSSLGQVKVWKVSPLFKGIGWVSMMGACCVLSFYAALMSIAFFYLFSSFKSQLPWAVCDDAWVGLGAGSYVDNVTGLVEPRLECNENDSSMAYDIFTGNKSETSLAQLFFENEVVKAKFQIMDGLGAPEWRLTLLLLLTWTIIWATLVRGVKSTGKIAYFTALFPYVVLITMLIRGVTLPNAWSGIKYFIVPDWEKMKSAQIWYEAVNQCFFSLTTCFGVLQMFGSYNPFRQNIYRDAWIISGMDTFTSLLAGFTVFAVLGNLAGELEVDISVVTLPGPGLTFISFAQGLSKFPAPQVFSVLFYLMLLTLGIGTGTAITGSLVTLVCDQFPDLKRWQVTTGISILGFMAGLIYITPGGFFILDLVEHFGANFVIYILAIIELSAISYVYGLRNFITDIQFMLGFRVGIYWIVCWGVIIPLGLSAILIYVFTIEKRWTYNGMPYPDSGIISGWLLSALILSIYPICAMHTISKTEGSSLLDKARNALKPHRDWGPQNLALRKQWRQFKEDYQNSTR